MLKRSKRNRVILLEEGNPLSWKIAKKYRKVYVYSGNFRKANKLPDDMLNQIDSHSSYYRAGREIDWVYDQYAKMNEAGILNEIMKDERAHFTIKKNILEALGGLFYSFILAEKFIKQYEIKEPIDFIPKSFPYSLYQIASKKKGLFFHHVNIPADYLKAMKYREVIKNIQYRAKLLFYPFWISLKMRLKRTVSEPRRKYRYAIHVWNSWVSSVAHPYRFDLFENDGCVNPRNALYIIDGDVTESNLSKVKANGHDCCCFKEMVRGYPVLKYIKEMFPYNLKLCLKCFSICKNGRSLLTESYLRAIQGYILWEIFYSGYYADIFITIQEPGNINRVLVQKKHGARCLFIFCSTSYDVVSREDINTHTDSYYSFMIYDAIISSHMSNEYLKRNNNFIGTYINVGVLRSDIIFQMKHDTKLKSAMREKLGTPLDKRIIGFFDTNVGKKGMFTNREGFKMLDDIYRFLESNNEYFIVFGSRGHYHLSEDIDVKKAFNRLIEHKRVIYINKLPALYYAFDVMGVCDLVIGAFTGSAPLESVSGGIRTLCYTPERFDKDFFILNNFPRFCVHNYDDLKKNADYWLYQCTEEDFCNFQSTYIHKYVDNYCDGRAVERLHSVLQHYNKPDYVN